MASLYKVRVTGVIEVDGNIVVRAENPNEAEIIARNSPSDVTWAPTKKLLWELDGAHDMRIQSIEEQKQPIRGPSDASHRGWAGATENAHRKGAGGVIPSPLPPELHHRRCGGG